MGLLILGAAYTVSSMHQTSVDAVRPRTELGRLVGDGLTVLDGLDDGNGTSLLDLYLAQAFHCAKDAIPDPDDCDEGRSENLSLKLESYLPIGAGYAIGLGNGAAVHEIYRLHLPQGEAVSTSRSIGLTWNLTFVASEFSCYEAGMDANFTLIPIDRGALSWARHANLTYGTTEVAGERAYDAEWWNVTLPDATRPAQGTFLANTSGNATLRGATEYGSCGLSGAGPALRAALREVLFTAEAPSVGVGSALRFDADLSAIAALPGVTLGTARVDVYEPIPSQGGTPDTWIPAGAAALTGATPQRSGTWDVEGHTLYGAHPALLRIPVTIGTESVELRKVMVVEVGLPTGEIPIDAPYRVTVQAWMPDWG